MDWSLQPNRYSYQAVPLKGVGYPESLDHKSSVDEYFNRLYSRNQVTRIFDLTSRNDYRNVIDWAYLKEKQVSTSSTALRRCRHMTMH